MTNPTPHGQVPDALRLAEEITNLECSSEAVAKTIAAAADELCRLHVENASLRASPTPPAEQQAAPKAAPGEPVKQTVREQIAAEVATQPAAQVEFLARYLCERDSINPDQMLDDNPVRLAWHREDLNAARLLAKLAELAPQQEAQEPTEIPEEIERMAADRYKVVPSHESMFHRWAVVAGTGTQQLYLGREVECQNMARKFAGAFLDGAFVAMQRTAPQPAPHLPERDASLPAERQGLFRKFVVGRVDGSDKPGGKHHGCTYFVLDVDHDPCARPALAAYAAACESTHPTLAADLRTKWGVVPAPQPAPAPLSDDVVREPLTDEQLAEMMRDTWGCASIAPRHALEFARAVERAHGIAQKGGS